MKAFNVSENIGFDGSSYYCRRCGKAGYERPTQVRGHLAMCAGTLARKGIAPTTTCNQLQPVASGVDGSLGGSQLPVVPVVAGDVVLRQEVAELKNQMARMTNEYSHMLRQQNLPQQVAQVPGESWIKQNLVWVVLGGLMLMAFFSGFGQPCQCEPGSTRGSGSGLNFSKLGERALNKGIDTAITRGLGKVLR